MYDSLRDAFVGERLTRRDGGQCGCLPVHIRGQAFTEGSAIDCDRQLEQMRATLARVALEAPTIDLSALTNEVFDSVDSWREHYLWWLESEALLAHDGAENQTTLTLTSEGMSVLTMLEATRPGSNVDMSPAALLAAEVEEDGHEDVTVIFDTPHFLHRRR